MFEQPPLNENKENWKNSIERLSENNQLLAHQTHEHFAEEILRSTSFHNNGFIESTAILTNPENIKKVIDEMNNPIDDREYGIVHRSSNAIVILAIPNKSVDKIREDDEFKKFTIKSIDNYLIERGIMGLSNELIFGYIKQDGTIVKNPNYDSGYVI